VSACELSADIARAGCYQLIETLASEIAEAVLALPGALAVEVTVRKPDAVAPARNVAVQIRRP
jgi:dihydroneopterin aldolase